MSVIAEPGNFWLQALLVAPLHALLMGASLHFKQGDQFSHQPPVSACWYDINPFPCLHVMAVLHLAVSNPYNVISLRPTLCKSYLSSLFWEHLFADWSLKEQNTGHWPALALFFQGGMWIASIWGCVEATTTTTCKEIVWLRWSVSLPGQKTLMVRLGTGFLTC